MKIIGISGKAQSGKDTLCTYLLNEFESRDIFAGRQAFADNLKSVIGSTLFDLTTKQMYTSEGKSVVDPRYNRTPRFILQQAGTLLRQVYENIWVDSVLRKADKYPDWWLIVPDLRFPNEFKAIEKRGGILVRLNRDVRIGDGAEHASETGLDGDWEWDYEFQNDGPIENLDTLAKMIVRDALVGEQIDSTTRNEAR